MKLIKCPYCEATEIERGIQVSDIEGSGTGLKAIQRFLSVSDPKIEPVLADLCTSCGTVVRLYVQNPNRKWSKVPPPADV